MVHDIIYIFPIYIKGYPLPRDTLQTDDDNIVLTYIIYIYI